MKKLLQDIRGAGALEFAIILPLLLAIVFAVIEFGAYFVKDQLALNAIGSISAELRNSPSSMQARENARKYGGSFMAFGENPNFFCAQSYHIDNRADAEDNLCTQGWNTARPAGTAADETYLIALVAATNKLDVVFSNFLPDIRRTEIIEVGGSSLPDCNDGEIILKTAAGFECRTISIEKSTLKDRKRANGNRASGWGADCPAGYTVAGCSTTCHGTEGEIDLSFTGNGCRVDGNSKCGSPGNWKDLTVWTNCVRVVYN